jgi:hypothetical protein
MVPGLISNEDHPKGRRWKIAPLTALPTPGTEGPRRRRAWGACHKMKMSLMLGSASCARVWKQHISHEAILSPNLPPASRAHQWVGLGPGSGSSSTQASAALSPSRTRFCFTPLPPPPLGRDFLRFSADSKCSRTSFQRVLISLSAFIFGILALQATPASSRTLRM